MHHAINLLLHIFNSWKRKIKIKSASLLLVTVILILFILFYEGQRPIKVFSSSVKDTSSKSELLKAQRKVTFLKSVLKRHGISEEKYIEENLPVIYVITPTHSRPIQKAELTRLKSVFLHVAALHWIIVEDVNEPSTLVSNFLQSSGLPYTHLHVQTPPEWKLHENDPRWWKPRGVLQRNKAIDWLRGNVRNSQSGVVYFADDDNTYSIELFDEMRYTEQVSVWPVGLVGGVLVERPAVDARGKVVGWKVGWRSDRMFATDMAGFAVNLNLILSTPNAYFSHTSQRGFLESDFLEKLVQKKDLEPRADLCTKVATDYALLAKNIIRFYIYSVRNRFSIQPSLIADCE